MTERAEQFMRDTDAFSWYLESDPGLHATILAIAWLDEPPDVDILTARLERAIRLVPRFRQRPLAPPGRLATPRWVDSEIDLSLHLRRIGAPWPHTPATVIEYARIEAMSSFDLTRPLWQFTLIEGLAGNRAALIMKVHHSLTDGIGGSKLALLLFETTEYSEVGSPVPALEDPGRAPGTVELVRDALVYDLRRVCRSVRQGLSGALPTAVHVIRHPVGSTSEAWATARSVVRFVQPVRRTRSRVMTDRSLDRHLDLLSLDFPDLKQAGVMAGGSLNDAFVASVTGGLRRYHERHGSDVEELRITMPISVRNEDDSAASNRITLARFDVPVGVTDPAERVRLTGSRCRAARNERALPFSNSIAATLNLLPSGVVGSMLKHIDVLASNVPGVNVPLYLGGAPVSGYYAFGPTTGSAVNVTLFTYCGTCCVGFTIDTAAVPDSDVLMECFRQGFEEVLGLVEDSHPVVRPLDDGPAGNGVRPVPEGGAVPPS
jgi:diacylglycerol O-acyltransferase / wax synthase